MLNSLPEETTQLLIDICTSLTPLMVEDDEVVSPGRQPSASGPSYLGFMALNRAPTLAPGAVPSDRPVRSHERSATHVESQEDSRTETPPTQTPTESIAHTSPIKHVKRPSPRLYFPHFIDHKRQFILFLESVALKRWEQSLDSSPQPPTDVDPSADSDLEKRDQTAVWNTLLELYLSPPDDPDAAYNKAMRLLRRDDIPYDHTHALILCSTQNYTPGLVLLWEKMGMYEDVIRFWIDKEKDGSGLEASTEVIRCLDRYGAKHPHLYPLVLRFLTSTPELLSRHSTDVSMILEHIDQEKIMPPLSIVQLLSRNGVATVGLVKEWLMTHIKSARNEIETVGAYEPFRYLHPKNGIVSTGPTTYSILSLGDTG